MQSCRAWCRTRSGAALPYYPEAISGTDATQPHGLSRIAVEAERFAALFSTRPLRPPARVGQILHGLLLDDELSVEKQIGRLADLAALLIFARIRVRRRLDDDREGAAVVVERRVEVEHA